MKYWECSKCGKCCYEQPERMDLNKDDIKYFPPESYVKYLGCGETKSKIEVIGWRLKTKRCPLYNDKIGCTIYENRPMICRKFPYARDFYNGKYVYGIDTTCTQAPKPGETLKIYDGSFDIIFEFDKYVADYFQRMYKEINSKKLWVYKNFKWKPKK